MNLFVAHGPPEHIRSDNGPEFVARNLRGWLGRIGEKTLYIEGIAIVIAHRPSALAPVDKILAMAKGQVQAFGPKSDVLKQVLQPVPGPQDMPRTPPPIPPAGRPPWAAAASLKIVTDNDVEGNT